MENKNISLTAAEWNVMECLWEKSPRTGREAVEWLEIHTGWSRSTTLTLLRRMTAKGLLASGDDGGIKTFSPLVRREDAVIRETEDFLHRVYKGSVSMLISSLTKKQSLSREEIDELYAILRQAEEGDADA